MSKARKAVPNFEAGWNKADEAKYATGAAAEATDQHEGHEEHQGRTEEATADPSASSAESAALPPSAAAGQVLGAQILQHIAAPPAGYHSNHIELKLSREEAELVARLRVGLTENHRQLAKGRHVESANDAVRWLLQQVMAICPAVG